MSLIHRLPVQVALAALVVYGFTLARSVTIASLGLTGNIAGWDYVPMTSQPLFWLLTLPVRLLPAAGIPLALNFFSAVCAALTLGCLVATLELAAWDRPLETLNRWPARLPLILAALVCGLEFSFWQAATQATGEALQILLLAGAIWALMHYRRSDDLRWLKLAVLVWSLGLVENWMMLITLPLFVVALFWLGKVRLLNGRVLAALGLAGLAGSSLLLLLLPLVNGLAPDAPAGVGQHLWLELKTLKHLSFNTSVGLWRGQKQAALAVVIFYLLSLLPLLIHKRDEGTRNKGTFDQYEIWFQRALQAGLLLACLWLALDPAIGLRQILRDKADLTTPLLSLDYLLALSVALLAGNLLLAFDLEARTRRHRNPFIRTLARAFAPVLSGIFVVMLIGLVGRNAPAVTEVNRQPLAGYGRAILRSLPPGGGVMLGDAPLRVASFQIAVAESGKERQWWVIDTSQWANRNYRRHLARQPQGETRTNDLTLTWDDPELLVRFNHLYQSNRVYYLHPSSGWLFESYDLQPLGLAYAVKSLRNAPPQPARLAPELIAAAEKQWDQLVGDARPRPPLDAKKPPAAGVGAIARRLYLKPIELAQTKAINQMLSAGLDTWGVELQRAGQLGAAQQRFLQASALNPDNVAARVNLECNASLQAGRALSVAGVATLAAQITGPPPLSRFLLRYGPVDEPAFCYVAGRVEAQAGLARQAMEQFERAARLATNALAPRLALAELYVRSGRGARAQTALRQIRSDLPEGWLKTNVNLAVNLALVEAGAWFASTNVAQADQVLQRLLAEHSGAAKVKQQVGDVYAAYGQYPQALALLKELSAGQPNDPRLLYRQAEILARAGDQKQSFATLDGVLALTNDPAARLLHGELNFKSGRLNQSEQDYQWVAALNDYSIVGQLGLAQVALARQLTNAAIEHLAAALKRLPENSPQQREIARQILELQHPQ